MTLKIGVLGPVGSGKTTLIEVIAQWLSEREHTVGIITNDVVSTFDASRIYNDIVLSGRLPKDNLVGIVTGGCPHTAIREDPSVNLRALEELVRRSSPDVILLESGGDNVMSSFSPILADYTIFVLDTSAGDKYPQKGGIGISESDLLIINKIDLAPYVGANLQIMEEGARRIRQGKPFVMVSLKNIVGVEKLFEILREDLGV